jgi:spore coat-associated protein N
MNKVIRVQKIYTRYGYILKEESFMSLKKALGMGVASAALGMSLIGGGTFAAFSDTETVQNSYAAGTLNLQLKDNGGHTMATELFSSTLKNLKPGDSVIKRFKLTNAGTLSIKDVRMQATYDGYVDGSDNAELAGKLGSGANRNSAADFASQIQVDVYGGDPNAGTLVWSGTLEQLKSLWTDDITNKTPNHSLPALPVDTDGVAVKLTFKADAGNTFQGDKFNVIRFQFLASQFNGRNFEDGENIEEINAAQTE